MSNEINNDDVCDACGVMVELGSVIHEDDCVLTLPISSPDEAAAKALAGTYITQAKAKFADCEVSEKTEPQGDGILLTLSLTFSCTAERLIFEMSLR